LKKVRKPLKKAETVEESRKPILVNRILYKESWILGEENLILGEGNLDIGEGFQDISKRLSSLETCFPNATGSMW
jgi:hypothetical protein